ncbi:MAG: rhodanese-like domain-containing protein [Candidatus Erginobacter occultus]|nr:rhodanese-like domain-containing protein [Candidatus Erginobacter occultus]
MTKLRLLSLEGLLEMKLNEEPFQLVEVLSADLYRGRHIPGAINLPLEELAETAGSRLKPGMTVVVYCGKYSCPASTNAARKLTELGFPDVLDFKAGKHGWAAAGLAFAGKEEA